MESKRTDKLGQTLQQTIGATLSSKLEKTLKSEMKNTTVPGTVNPRHELEEGP